MAVKEALLSILEAHKDEFISGEALASQLCCSRAAIWKAVEALRLKGCEIEAITNKGYRLRGGTDLLSAGLILSHMSEAERAYFKIEVYEEISSTNMVLKERAVREQLAEGRVLVSDFQSQGRGRLGRSFFSPKGDGLYLSLLLRPKMSAERLLVTAQAAVAVYRAVREVCGLTLDIKWVNDLYLNGRKVCGILSEGQSSFESGQIEFVIVGIGLNLYEPEGGYPEDIRGKAGSLFGRDRGRVDRNALTAAILRALAALVYQPELAPEYIERNMIPGRQVYVADAKNPRYALARAILEDGALELEEADGSRTRLLFGEVSVSLPEMQANIQATEGEIKREEE